MTESATPDTHPSPTPRLRRIHWIALGALALAIVIAVALVLYARDGDGVTVPDGYYVPVESARSTEPVRVRFSAPMDRDSVAAHFDIAPAVDGTLAWSDDRTLSFTPDDPWTPGTTYTVTLEGGAAARDSAAVLDDTLTWQFTGLLPRVAYLHAAESTSAPELFISDITTGTATQLTTTDYGVEDFAVSPSGRQIAYTRSNSDGGSDIWLVDVARADSRALTACVNARCSAPAWHPDETRVAYQRQESGGGQQQGRSAIRSWVVDIRTVETRLLFDDPQLLGMTPQWSPDGSRIAVYDPQAGAIRITEVASGDEHTISIVSVTSGAFSPDSTRLIYPILTRGLMGQTFYTHLEIVDLVNETYDRISGDTDAPVEDTYASWSPDGSQLVVTRRYLDDRFTTGRQIHVLDATTGAATAVIVDAQYTHAAPQWDRTGERIVYQRYDLLAPDAEPAIWVYDIPRDSVTQIAQNAFFPAWVP